ncbi:XRE family transcriptional regulator [Brevundimonas sp.]|uniref:XRE family transcriptional regulator n=2 Tax=Brevundimonas TaxID=41275 RepID=UPI0035B2769C
MARRPRRSDAQLIGAAARAVRRERKLTAREVAAAMSLHERTYESFEGGANRINLDHVERFARATNSDPYALQAALWIGSPAFAARCADNKLMLVLSIALQRLDKRLGDDLRTLDTRLLITVFTEAFDRVASEAVTRAETARAWMREGEADLRDGRPTPGR